MSVNEQGITEGSLHSEYQVFREKQPVGCQFGLSIFRGEEYIGCVVDAHKSGEIVFSLQSDVCLLEDTIDYIRDCIKEFRKKRRTHTMVKGYLVTKEAAKLVEQDG